MERRNPIPIRASTLVGLLVLLSAVLIGVSIQPVDASRADAFGVYSCCGVTNCSILSSTNACPSGNTQCDGIKIGGIQSTCCTDACNDPPPVDPFEPHPAF